MWSWRWLGSLQSFTASNTNVTPGTRWEMALASHTEEILPRICHKKSQTNNQELSSVPEDAPIFVLAVWISILYVFYIAILHFSVVLCCYKTFFYIFFFFFLRQQIMRCKEGRGGENDSLKVTLHLTIAKICVSIFSPSLLASKAIFELSSSVINWTDLVCVADVPQTCPTFLGTVFVCKAISGTSVTDWKCGWPDARVQLHTLALFDWLVQMQLTLAKNV